MVNIRFVTSRDPVSWLIRAAEMGFLFSHVEAVMPDGTMLGAHYTGGVQARPAGYDSEFDPIETIVAVPTTNVQADIFHGFLISQLGKPYDMVAIGALAGREAWPDTGEILAGLNKPWVIPTKWICSELVDAALEAAGIIPGSPFKAETCTPRDVYRTVSALVHMPPPTRATRVQVGAAARPV